MTWLPTQRILSSALPPSARLRGVCPCELMAWPDAAQGSGNDYTVDFSDQAETGDRIVQISATAPGASIAWVSIFGNKATVWLTWEAAGTQAVSFTARMQSGAYLSATGYASVGCTPTNLPPIVPDFAPNAFVVSGVIVPDANGNPLILG